MGRKERRKLSDKFKAEEVPKAVPQAISAGSADSKKEPVRLIVTLSKVNDELKCCLKGKEPMSLDGLALEVRTFLKANPNMVVVIRAGDKMPFEDISQIMKVCANEKVYKMIFRSAEPAERDTPIDKEKPAEGEDVGQTVEEVNGEVVVEMGPGIIGIQLTTVDFPQVLPREIRLLIHSDESVIMNANHVFPFSDRELKGLVEQLIRVQEEAKKAGYPCFVTLAPTAQTKHRRIIEVMDACAEAGIKNLIVAKHMEK